MSDVQRYEMRDTSRGYDAWQDLVRDPDGDWVRYEDYATLAAERDALQEELRKLMETANYNAALSISELRESMNVPKDQPIHGRCANCHEWHPIADMWAECTPCFDETVAKQAKAERDALARDMQGVRAIQGWIEYGGIVDSDAESYLALDGMRTVIVRADSLPALGQRLLDGGYVDGE